MSELSAVASKTYQGPILQINEDNVNVNITEKLYMLLDGFGGSGAGDVATKFIIDNISRFYTQIALDPEKTLPFFFSSRHLIEGNALINSILFSHKKLFQENMKKEMNSRSGSSGIFACQADTVLVLVAVGNCSAYLLRENKLEKIFFSDTFSMLSPSAKSHESSLPMNAMGLFPDLYYQVKELKISRGDKVLLLSDGVSNWVEDFETKFILEKSDVDNNGKIDLFINLANQRGNTDNQSVMILEY
jgi:serine/threonine protein phosphatase PrpC